jgi:hypothetical protein
MILFALFAQINISGQDVPSLTDPFQLFSTWTGQTGLPLVLFVPTAPISFGF